MTPEKQNEIIHGIIQRSGGIMFVKESQVEEYSTVAGLSVEAVRLLKNDDSITVKDVEEYEEQEITSLYYELLFNAIDSELLFDTVHESIAGTIADFIVCDGWEEAVKVLQKTLNIIGKRDNMVSMLEIDGVFGSQTTKAWKWYVAVNEDTETGRPDYRNLTWFRKVFLDQRFYYILNKAIEGDTRVKDLPQWYNRMIQLRRVR